MKFTVGKKEAKGGFVEGFNRFQYTELKQNNNGSYTMIFTGLITKDGVEQPSNFKVRRFLTKKDSQEVDYDLVNSFYLAIGKKEIKPGDEVEIPEKAEGDFLKVIQIALKNRKDKATGDTFLDMPLYSNDGSPLIIGAEDDPSNVKPEVDSATDF